MGHKISATAQSFASHTLPTVTGLDCLGIFSGSRQPFRSTPLGSSWQVPWSVAPCASCHLPVVDCEDVLDHFTNDCLPTRRGRSLPSFEIYLEFLPYLLISFFLSTLPAPLGRHRIRFLTFAPLWLSYFRTIERGVSVKHGQLSCAIQILTQCRDATNGYDNQHSIQ
jgi:hypothetical protein